MPKALRTSAVYLLMLASADLTWVYAINSPELDNKKRAGSPFAGSYEGVWTAAPTPAGCYSGGETKHKETWDVSIAPDGRITGAESADASGTPGKLSGSIGKSGSITLFLKDGKVDNTIKGKVTKRGFPLLEERGKYRIYLMGKLKIFRRDGKLCGTILVNLNRK